MGKSQQIPADDGWITNSHPLTADEERWFSSTYGAYEIGEPYPTQQRSVETLKGLGIVGVYLVKGGK